MYSSCKHHGGLDRKGLGRNLTHTFGNRGDGGRNGLGKDGEGGPGKGGEGLGEMKLSRPSRLWLTL
jgi:hypothetical protein